VALDDGSVATIAGDRLELRDAGGRLMVRYAGGTAEIAAPEGDLVLAAPSGRVVIRSGLDVAIEAPRDVVHRAGRRVDLAAGPAAGPALRIEPERAVLQTGDLEVKVKKSRLLSGQVAVVARTVATTAEEIATRAERWELQATSVIERARDALREVSELAEARAGRMRTLVGDLFSLHARQTTVVSTDDTSIDGKRILLG
jgi:hypothetical protein